MTAVDLDGPVVVDAAGQTVRLITLCDRLGLEGSLQASRRLLKRSEELGELVRRSQVQARMERAQELQRLITAEVLPDAAVLVAHLNQTDPWVDVDLEAGRPSRAVSLLMGAARVARGHAAAAASAEGSDLYGKLQRIAGEEVAATAKVPSPPQRIWGSPDPAGEMVRDGRERDWAVLVRSMDRFALAHEVAGMVRRMGSLGASALLPDGAPDLGFMFKAWAEAAEGQLEWRRLHPGLRLKHAINANWLPGLWLSADLEAPVRTQRWLSAGLLIPSPLRPG